MLEEISYQLICPCFIIACLFYWSRVYMTFSTSQSWDWTLDCQQCKMSYIFRFIERERWVKLQGQIDWEVLTDMRYSLASSISRRMKTIYLHGLNKRIWWEILGRLSTMTNTWIGGGGYNSWNTVTITKMRILVWVNLLE